MKVFDWVEGGESRQIVRMRKTRSIVTIMQAWSSRVKLSSGVSVMEVQEVVLLELDVIGSVVVQGLAAVCIGTALARVDVSAT
jgi:hypothetical protein